MEKNPDLQLGMFPIPGMDANEPGWLVGGPGFAPAINEKASCAMVYPAEVNGRDAHFWDPWANDQDWGLYYNLKLREIYS